MTGAAGGADLADDGKDHVLGGYAGCQIAVNGDPHVLGRLLDQRLGGQHMLDLGSADAECQRAERAVGRGVRITTDDGHAGLGESLLRPDHMNDALADIVHGEIGNTEIGSILGKRLDLNAGFLVGDAGGTVCCRDVVVGDCEGAVRRANGPAGIAQTFECLRAGHFVNKVPVDVNQAGTVILAMHNMRIPDFVKKGLWRRHVFLR